MTMLLRVAERVINRPLLVHPDKVPLILGVLEGRIPVGDVAELRRVAEAHVDAMPTEAQAIMRGPSPGASRFVGSVIDTDPDTGKQRQLPYRRTSDGVAVITITGSLINRGAWLGSNSGETSYEGIKFQVAQAALDPRTKAILLDIESPGGEAVGAFEAATAIRDAAKAKPVIAVVNGMAASAAYALASGATKIINTPTGLAGSIGVVLLHADYSGWLEQKGIKPTLIFAGAHKVDGNPFEALPPAVREDLQAEVDQFYDLFVKTVAAGRKTMTPAQIRGTEARTFIGADAVKQGLADEVGSFEQALAQLSKEITRGQGRNPTSTPAKGAKMDQSEGAVAANPATTTQAEVTKAKADGLAEGSKAAAERIAAILNHEEAKGRAGLAQHLAFGTTLTVEQAAATLKASPKETAAAPQPASIADRAAAAGAALALGEPAGRPAAAKPDLNPAAIYESRRKQTAATRH